MRPVPIICRVGLWAVFTWKTATALAVERESRPLITPAPRLSDQLDKRDGVTWAYVNGDSASPLTCPAGLTTSNSYGFAGIQACCNALSCVNDWSTCLPYGVATCTLGLPCSDLYSSILTCGQAEGCVTYRSITGPNDPGGVFSYACGATKTELLALGSPTNVGGAAAATTLYSTAESPTPAGGAAASTIYSTAGTETNVFGLGGETGVAEPSSVGTTSSAFTSTAIANSAPSVSTSTSSTSTSLSSSSSTSSSSLSTGSAPSTTRSAPATTNSDSGSGSSTNSSSSNGLDTGSIVGIVAGVVSLIAIFVTIWLKWPKTVTRFLSCGICTTIEDDAPRTEGHYGVTSRYIPHRYEQPPRYQPPQYHYEQHPMHSL